ncbi:MAG: hypothetical protein V4760_13100 [Bdellovibrionota bacterium]
MRIVEGLVACSLGLGCLLVTSAARAEKVKIGSYSGRPGNFALTGVAFDTRRDLVAMNLETRNALTKALVNTGLGGTKDCEVEGDIAQIGTQTFYALYKIVSCK